MGRLYNMRLNGQQWGNHICPEIRDKASTSEPEQHDEIELTPVQVDTNQNDFQATPNDSESNSSGGYGQYMQVTPPRSYKAEEFVGEDVEVENAEGGQGQANGVVEDGQGQANGVVDDGQDQANGVVEDGQGQANGVFEDGQGIVNVLVEEAFKVPNVQVQQVRPISDILKSIRRIKLERILKIKLEKSVGGVHDLGNSKGKALIID
ncbi:unnamed protein product [Lactuca virosa]|uniref:Uncharacterized protein n=1 Tax=Lactuca virosa TaxID=75947 RepID=A0AAU9M3Q0_9ASTR|nr:unnamed protein product [Lactuca virosa]